MVSSLNMYTYRPFYPRMSTNGSITRPVARTAEYLCYDDIGHFIGRVYAKTDEQASSIADRLFGATKVASMVRQELPKPQPAHLYVGA